MHYSPTLIFFLAFEMYFSKVPYAFRTEKQQFLLILCLTISIRKMPFHNSCYQSLWRKQQEVAQRSPPYCNPSELCAVICFTQLLVLLTTPICAPVHCTKGISIKAKPFLIDKVNLRNTLFLTCHFRAVND